MSRYSFSSILFLFLIIADAKAGCASDSTDGPGRNIAICISGFGDRMYSDYLENDPPVSVYSERRTNYTFGLEYVHELSEEFWLRGRLRVNPYWTATYRQRIERPLPLEEQEEFGTLIKKVFNASFTLMGHYVYRELDVAFGIVTGYYTGGHVEGFDTRYNAGFTDYERNLLWRRHFILAPTIEVGYNIDEFRIALFHQQSVSRPIRMTNGMGFTPGMELGIHVSYFPVRAKDYME